MATISDWSLVDLRRDLHRYPEVGWTEFRTTALLAEELDSLGYEVFLGSDAVSPEDRLGVPSEDELSAALRRAREAGAPEAYLDRMEGISGLVAERRFGDGPVVGVRVDIDALPRFEADGDDHRPAREGFASVHPNEMHACGHDAHAAIGVGVARSILETDFDGTLRLFVQPAEEGGRGGYPMSLTDRFDDVDGFLAVHVGLDRETGTVVAGYERPLSNAKLDVVFSGEPAHAGGAPQEGRNAMQALAAAVQGLYGIPRHADGATRINVGMVESPNNQNVIPEEARMRVEVRGETASLNEYMLEHAERIVGAAAEMHDCGVETSLYGKTTSFVADDSMVDRVAEAAGSVDGVGTVTERAEFGGSEDASYLIRRVQEEGGEATYVGIGASNVAGHHTAYFDIDEECIRIGVDVLTETVASYS